ERQLICAIEQVVPDLLHGERRGGRCLNAARSLTRASLLREPTCPQSARNNERDEQRWNSGRSDDSRWSEKQEEGWVVQQIRKRSAAVFTQSVELRNRK